MTQAEYDALRAAFLELHPGAEHFVVICETCHLVARPGHQCPLPMKYPMKYVPDAETFFDVHNRMAGMHGYEALERIEAKLDRLERALKAGAIGAWGNGGRD